MAAEEYAENWENDEEGNFTYVSGKYSKVMNQTRPRIPKNMKKNIDAYRFIRNSVQPLEINLIIM